MALEVPFRTVEGQGRFIRMCDYASAGNTWTTNSGYRVWLPQPLSLAAPFAGVSMKHEAH